MYATIFFRPVKGTPKIRVNSRQKLFATKQRKSIFWNENSHFYISTMFGILGVFFGVLGVLFGVLGVLFGVPGVLVGNIYSLA